jgi:molecular chaperone HtpG
MFAAGLVGAANDMAPTMEKSIAPWSRTCRTPSASSNSNPAHPLVTGLRKAYEKRGDDGQLAGTVGLVYVTALLQRAAS